MRHLRLVLLSAFLAAPALAQDVAMDPVLAVVAGSTIPLSTVDGMAASALRKLKNDQYLVRRSALEDVFFQVLSAKEAEARGVSAEEFLKAEVDDKAAPVTEADKKAFFEKNKERMSGQPYEEAAPLIEEHLRQVNA